MTDTNNDPLAPLYALMEMHTVMTSPFEWSADTAPAVAEILSRLGFSFPINHDYDDDGELTVDLNDYRPPWASLL